MKESVRGLPYQRLVREPYRGVVLLVEGKQSIVVLKLGGECRGFPPSLGRRAVHVEVLTWIALLLRYAEGLITAASEVRRRCSKYVLDAVAIWSSSVSEGGSNGAVV